MCTFKRFRGLDHPRKADAMSNISKLILCFVAGFIFCSAALNISHTPATTTLVEKRATRENLIDVLHQLDPDSYTYDPAELASWATYLDRDGSAIPDEISISLDLRAEAVKQHLINDPEYARRVYKRIAPMILTPVEP